MTEPILQISAVNWWMFSKDLLLMHLSDTEVTKEGKNKVLSAYQDKGNQGDMA